LVVVAVLMPCAAGAQRVESDDVGVIRVTTEFYRDSLRKGRIVIDADSPNRRGPAISTAVVDQVVQATRASKGRLNDLMDCTKGTGRRACVMRDESAVVLTFSQPVIRDDTATVSVSSVYSPVPGRVEGVEEELTLVKRANGQWRVERVVLRGVT
jgi:regulator of extracellular matrix RemA (YlzA/DUF370 family)